MLIAFTPAKMTMGPSFKLLPSKSTQVSVGGRLWGTLRHWMEHHPIAANSLLTLNLWIAGDILAQFMEHRSGQEVAEYMESGNLRSSTSNENENKQQESLPNMWQIDFLRTAQCASYGGFFTGPLFAVWYPFLDRTCKRFDLTKRYGIWAAPIAKVIADEFIMDPPCLVAFYGYMNVCEGGTFTSFQHKMEQEFVRSWLTSVATWPVVLLGTFRYLPVYAQAPFINACCILWDGFLSHRNAEAKLKEVKINIEKTKMRTVKQDNKINEQETKQNRVA